MTPLDNVLALVATRIPAAGIDCLLIGGFAVNQYGYSRTTLDIDFMISGDRVNPVIEAMTQAGFINITTHENVVFFNKPGTAFRVDFLKVDAETMRNLLLDAVTSHMRGYSIRIPSLRNLIAMKIFALTTSTERRLPKDLPDIAFLTVINNLDLETDVRPLCNRFGSNQVYEMIRKYVETIKTP